VSVHANVKLNGNLLKGISGGDITQARSAGDNPVNISLTATLFSFANDLPAIDPVDEALKDRLRSIPWRVQFKGEKRDNTIRDWVKTEEASNALFWVMNDAYVLYQQEGLKDIDEIMSFTKELTDEVDEFKIIFDKNFEIGSNEDYVLTNEVYRLFREYEKSEAKIARKLENDFEQLKTSTYEDKTTL
jgi:phage/plasmid-associated DNA primase